MDELVFSGVKSTEITLSSRIRLFSGDLPNQIFWGVVGTVLLCFLGQIRLDWVEDVPITLQTLLVVLMPILLGTGPGTLAVAAYVLVGLLGAPVFSGGNGGIDVITGPTGGFLIGFVGGAWLCGKMVHNRWGRHWLAVLLSVLAGHQVILLVGLPWYGWQQGWGNVMPLWANLIPGMLIKVLLATMLGWLMRVILKNRRTSPAQD